MYPYYYSFLFQKIDVVIKTGRSSPASHNKRFMAFRQKIEHIFFTHAEIFLSFFSKYLAYRFSFIFRDLFIQVKKRNIKFCTELLSSVCFARSHEADKEYFHDSQK